MSKLRFAPTPSGYLHLGNALNFVLNAQLAARLGATMLLRIDDLDAERKRPEYVQDVFDTLAYLGLDWQEGPRDLIDFETNWSQHQRLETYNTLLDTLRTQGRLFACAKSRKDLADYEVYPDEFRTQAIPLDTPNVAWRIITDGADPSVPKDFVVRRRDGIPAYQVASLADDVNFGITHIVRGDDLKASSAAQLFLADCLGLKAFQQIKLYHHALIKNEAGEKLSKSAGAMALKTQREQGASPQLIYDLAQSLVASGELRVARQE